MLGKHLSSTVHIHVSVCVCRRICLWLNELFIWSVSHTVTVKFHLVNYSALLCSTSQIKVKLVSNAKVKKEFFLKLIDTIAQKMFWKENKPWNVTWKFYFLSLSTSFVKIWKVMIKKQIRYLSYKIQLKAVNRTCSRINICKRVCFKCFEIWWKNNRQINCLSLFSNRMFPELCQL